MQCLWWSQTGVERVAVVVYLMNADFVSDLQTLANQSTWV